VKTLRRRLTRLAAHHCAEQLGAELARLRVDQRGHLMGFLYVDGHVRAYHGQRAISSKAYVARRHLAMPASTDYWLNDRSGDPLLVITGEVNAALTKALPRLLREVRDLVGERRVTVVFDRGGWSPKLFDTMIKDGFDLLTYRKGRCRRINERRFIRRRAELDGRWVDYLLHDQPVGFMKGKLRLRQVTRLCDDGHQTQVITSRWDLRDIEIAYRMFERWRQENFFKYMREEFLLDALIDYQIEPENPTRTIPNPERRALIRRSVRHALILPSSNANTVPQPPTITNDAGRPCGASRSPTAGSASSCEQPALAWRNSSSSVATFPSASKSETSTRGPWSSSLPNAST
jgi:prepilin-type processing-associated H-X9-DG protein